MRTAKLGILALILIHHPSHTLLADLEVLGVGADDPFAVREWAAEFFYSDRGIVLDEDIEPEDVERVELRSIQVGYASVHAVNTVLLLWRESPDDTQSDVSITVDGKEVGAVPSLAPNARPGVNTALVTNITSTPASDPSLQFEARRDGRLLGRAVQSVAPGFPMGTDFTPECTQISPPLGGICRLEICWTNPGPPTSGFEFSVGGSFQLYREEGSPGELNREIVEISFQGDYSVRVTSILLEEDPDVSPFAFDDDGKSYNASGSFRGDAREITCPITCGAPPPPRFIRGVCRGSGTGPEIEDVLAALGYLFLESEEPPCLAACDSNADGFIDVGDPVHTLFYLFAGGSPPPGWADRTGDGTPDPTCQFAGDGESCGNTSSACG